MWMWVNLPHACFGVFADEAGKVVAAPPISKRSLGQDIREVADYYRKRGEVQTFGFNEQIVVGEEGERRFRLAMEAKGYVVVDTTKSLRSQRRDIDMVVIKDGIDTNVEVKTDTHDTGNIFIELVDGDNRPGCVFRSRADVWVYVFPNQDVAYLMRLPELLLWLIDFEREYERKTVNSRRGRRKWVVYGIAVPIERLIDDGIAKRVRLPSEGSGTTSTVA